MGKKQFGPKIPYQKEIQKPFGFGHPSSAHIWTTICVGKRTHTSEKIAYIREHVRRAREPWSYAHGVCIHMRTHQPYEYKRGHIYGLDSRIS